MATFAEYTKMGREQLLKELAGSRKSLFDIRYQVINKQSKAANGITLLKKGIAQILTILNNNLENKGEVMQNVPAAAEQSALRSETKQPVPVSFPASKKAKSPKKKSTSK